MGQKQIIGCTLSQLEELLSGMGHKPQLARELCVSIYRRRCNGWADTKTLPLSLRKKLADEFSFYAVSPVKIQESNDGTLKYLFRNTDGHPFESAYMPGKKRNTLCVSTQSGCRMGCHFCYTGAMGFNANLSAGEIVGQLLGIPQSYDVNRVVLMGMGEPLDNFGEVLKALEIFTADWGFALGAANITLSTVGILPVLEEIIDSKRCNIAISMHSPWHEVRERIMPIERNHQLIEVISFLRNNPIKKPLRLSFEYIVMPGTNDSLEDATEVARVLEGLKAHVNVMALNYKNNNSSPDIAAKRFRKMLSELNQPSTFRLSRGQDIAAACGTMTAQS